MRTLEIKLRPLTRFIAKVESVSTQAGHMAVPAIGPRGGAALPVREQPRSLVASTQDWAFAIMTDAGADVLPACERARRCCRVSGATLAQWRPQRVAVAGARIVRQELGRYFGAVTISNLVLGVGTAVTMNALDMPSPLLWGALAFTLNFVPYAGSAVTFVLLTIVALVSFDGVGKAVAVACTYLALTTFEGQILQPILVGRRLDLSPLAVFLGLWFGGWLWGIAGVALAMPLLVAAKAVFNASQRSSSERRGCGARPTARRVTRPRAVDWRRAERRVGDDNRRRALTSSSAAGPAQFCRISRSFLTLTTPSTLRGEFGGTCLFLVRVHEPGELHDALLRLDIDVVRLRRRILDQAAP